ncbi:MAG: ethanolamine utilization protein EutJ, partial [Mailhella sp.]|nr:ethanolamine utilization protein EutJ [Mailhella sp.]
MDIDAVESRIAELERRISTVAEVSAREKLYVGVDLGTAYIVVVVVNGSGEPVACALEFAQVVRDGLVVDYVGATQIVRRLVGQLQERLGRELEDAAIAVPPGTGVRECATHRHVVEGAGLNVTSILDEPTAANAVLNVENGV